MDSGDKSKLLRRWIIVALLFALWLVFLAWMAFRPGVGEATLAEKTQAPHAAGGTRHLIVRAYGSNFALLEERFQHRL